MKISTVGKTIRARRRELGLTIEQLAEAVGCAKSYVSAIETGQRPNPSEPMLREFERALYLDPGTLVEAARWQATPATVRRIMAELQKRQEAALRIAELLAGTELASDGRLRGLLDDAYRSGEISRLLSLVREGVAERSPPEAGLPLEVPILNRRGEPMPLRLSDESGRLRIPDLDDPDAYALWVGDDSMAPDYRAGDLVVFSPARAAADGSDCYVRTPREAIFRRVYFEGESARLQPVNTRHSPLVTPRLSVEAIHAAVRVVREVEVTSSPRP